MPLRLLLSSVFVSPLSRSPAWRVQQHRWRPSSGLAVLLIAFLASSTCCKAACKSSQWKCPNSERCIPVYYLCDGPTDCEDGADEPPNITKEKCDEIVLAQIRRDGFTYGTTAPPTLSTTEMQTSATESPSAQPAATSAVRQSDAPSSSSSAAAVSSNLPALSPTQRTRTADDTELKASRASPTSFRKGNGNHIAAETKGVEGFVVPTRPASASIDMVNVALIVVGCLAFFGIVAFILVVVNARRHIQCNNSKKVTVKIAASADLEKGTGAKDTFLVGSDSSKSTESWSSVKTADTLIEPVNCAVTVAQHNMKQPHVTVTVVKESAL